MKKVVLFQHPTSRYGVLARMTLDIQRALERAGVQTALLSGWERMTHEDMGAFIVQHAPDCTFGINIAAGEGLSCLRHPSRALQLPHVYLSVDALSYCPQEVFLCQNVVALFVDGFSADGFTKKSARPAVWAPHAISTEDLHRAKSITPFDRPYEVTLVGSFMDFDAERARWRGLLTQNEEGQFTAIAEKALEDPNFRLLQEAERFIEQSSSLRFRLRDHGLTTYALVNSLERYCRGLDRERVLLSFKSRTVHVFSGDAEAWQARFRRQQNIVFHKEVSFDQVLHVCSQSQAVINSGPMIRQGLHERLLLALAAGSVVIASTAHPTPRWLEESGVLVPYTTSSIPTIEARLSAGKAGRDQAAVLAWLLAEHSWDARLAKVLPAIERIVSELQRERGENPFLEILQESLSSP